MERGLLRLPEENRFLVKARLADGSLFPSLGTVSFAEPSGASRPNSILVPQRAVQQGKSNFVWVINKDSKAEHRPVGLGGQNGNDRFILLGLRPGDRVVVDGGGRVSVGTPLKITPYVPPPGNNPPPAAPDALPWEIEQATGKTQSAYHSPTR